MMIIQASRSPEPIWRALVPNPGSRDGFEKKLTSGGQPGIDRSFVVWTDNIIDPNTETSTRPGGFPTQDARHYSVTLSLSHGPSWKLKDNSSGALPPLSADDWQ